MMEFLKRLLDIQIDEFERCNERLDAMERHLTQWAADHPGEPYAFEVVQ